MRTPDQKPGVNKNQNRLERGDDLAVWFGSVSYTHLIDIQQYNVGIAFDLVQGIPSVFCCNYRVALYFKETFEHL